MADKPTILIVGTLDTKASEILYLRSAILDQGTCHTKVLDVSRTQQLTVKSLETLKDELISPLTDIVDELESLDRGKYVERAISECNAVVQKLVDDGDINGIVSAAGSTGSSLATALMRNACPVGFPKLMVSTMASGDIKPYIEETDITMMYSVVDIAGINSILKQILSNAAGAIVGMTLKHAESKKASDAPGKRIAITMFGVTTPCVENIRKILSTAPHDVSDYEVFVFHATGSGGMAMERLIEEGRIDALIDLTTTEVADELFGGVLSAGPKRLEAAAKKGIPVVVSVGACDMVNFGPKDSVPDKYADRNLFVHNPTVTLMRTTKEENRQIGEFIASKLAASQDHSKVRVVLPKGGLSMIDKPDQPFHDTEADDELFKAIGEGLGDTKVEVYSYPEHINDEEFAVQVCQQLLEVMGISPRQYRLANARRRKWSFDHGRTIHAVRRASYVEVPDT